MKYTSEQMQQAIHEWQTSGLSKKAFCRERNITNQTFHYWFKRLNKTSSPSPGFTEVTIQSSRRTGGCEIIFPSGARMILQEEPSASWLRELLR